MDEQHKLLAKINLKKQNHINIDKELDEAISYCLEYKQNMSNPPEIYLPAECAVSDPLERIKAKFRYWSKQFAEYQKSLDLKQMDYISSIILGTFPDLHEYYFAQYKGIDLSLDDPRYKANLFAQYGKNTEAYIRGMEELNADLKRALAQTPEDIYATINNLIALTMDAYMELQKKAD